MTEKMFGEWQDAVNKYVQQGWQANGAELRYLWLWKSPAQIATNTLNASGEIDFLDLSGEIEKQWWVYLARCADETYYCGISTNPLRRELDHNSSVRGAKYTRARRPVTLVYWEGPMSKSDALKREIRIKSLKRAEKAALEAEHHNLLSGQV